MRFGRSKVPAKVEHTSHSVSPFLTARHEFDNAFGNLAQGKRNWQVVALVSFTLLTGVLLAYVRLASQSHITPYVVEVNRLGQAVAFGPAEPLKETDRRVVIAQLTQFVRNVRAVTPSAETERALIGDAYAFVDQRGAAFLNAYFSDPAHDPRALSTRMTRLIDVTSVLAVPTAESSHERSTTQVPPVWKIAWTEEEIPTAIGGMTSTAAWEGFLTVRIIPPTRSDVIQENPLGLFVTAITWTKLATRSSTSLSSGGNIP